jgi:DNA topoisomerase I
MGLPIAQPPVGNPSQNVPFNFSRRPLNVSTLPSVHFPFGTHSSLRRPSFAENPSLRNRPCRETAPSHSARESAHDAGLRYVSDQSPGIRRSRSGRAFRYFKPNGKPLNDPATLRRIKALAIPPAWTDVWICPFPTGHIQANGRDSKNRKQYRYHRAWRETRDENKYSQIIDFAKALPGLRRRVRRDLRQPGLGRDKVIASIVRLLELSAARVGNQIYARQNQSYGLTTLRDRHFKLKNSVIHLQFRGKGGKQHRLSLDNPRLGRIVKRCQDLPGQDLFQYLDDQGHTRSVTSSDVNEYLARFAKANFTAKVFRTWTGTVQAALALQSFTHARSKSESRRNIVSAIQQVAQHLGNTPSICKKSYVHPVILNAYPDGSLAAAFLHKKNRSARPRLNSLRPEEAAVLALLQRHLKQSADDTLTNQLAKSLRRWPARSTRRQPSHKTSVVHDAQPEMNHARKTHSTTHPTPSAPGTGSPRLRGSHATSTRRRRSELSRQRQTQR